MSRNCPHCGVNPINRPHRAECPTHSVKPLPHPNDCHSCLNEPAGCEECRPSFGVSQVDLCHTPPSLAEVEPGFADRVEAQRLARHDRAPEAVVREAYRTGRYEGSKTSMKPLPDDAAGRKAVPLMSGCLDYFPDALAAVAATSKAGNDQHNPGKPIRWDRSKSGDEADALSRHLLQRGTVDTDGIRHSAKVAWRALAMLQKELEEAYGLPLPRGAIPSHD